MTVNDLSPGFVIGKYTSQGHDHQFVMPVLPDTLVPGDPANTLLETRVSGTITFTNLVTDLADVWDGFFDTTDQLASIELWSKPTPSSNPVYVCSVAIARSGISSGQGIPLSQQKFTWRTTGGGILITQFMEGNFPVDQKYSPPYGSAAPLALSTYMLADDDCAIVGRDGTFPVAALHFITKTNDALRKKYVLD